MNCKPGDLAIIVYARLAPDLIGNIVEVVGPFGGDLFIDDAISGEFTWEVRYPDGRPILATFGAKGHREFRHSRALRDSCLRPIRDNPGADETLSWKDVPAPSKTKEKETA